jgi:hypothetical protein
LLPATALSMASILGSRGELGTSTACGSSFRGDLTSNRTSGTCEVIGSALKGLLGTCDSATVCAKSYSEAPCGFLLCSQYVSSCFSCRCPCGGVDCPKGNWPCLCKTSVRGIPRLGTVRSLSSRKFNLKSNCNQEQSD